MNLDPDTRSRLNNRSTAGDLRRMQLAYAFLGDPWVLAEGLTDGARATIRAILGGRPVRDADVDGAWGEVMGTDMENGR